MDPETAVIKSKRGLSAAVLKHIALATMLFNHVCIAYFRAFPDACPWLSEFHWYVTRISFVLYAFLISEGMVHTHDRQKYLGRLLAFALASEVFYDLCFSRTPFDFSDQNVFFDLFAGALAIVIYDLLRDQKAVCALVIVVLAYLTALLGFGYNLVSVFTVVGFYILRENRKRMLLLMIPVWLIANYLLYVLPFVGVSIPAWYYGVILKAASTQWHGLLAFPLIALYNGEKGRQLPRTFYYGVYPGHLLLIWFVISLLTGSFA